MKKLIGIIAAVAMAASVFALNDATSMSASIRIGGDEGSESNLFSYSKSNKAIADGKTDDAEIKSFMFKGNETKINLSIDLGKVGGSIDCGGNPGTIWFKPFDLEDMLKISLGNVGNGDALCGTGHFVAKAEEATPLNRWGGQGFRAETKPLDGLYLSAALYTTGSEKWWTVEGDYGTNFLASYEDADTVGKIKAFWTLQQKGEKQEFGIGWTKTFGAITPTVNVIGWGEEWTKTNYSKAKGQTTSKEAGLSKLVIEPTVKGSMDPLTWSVYVPVTFDFAKMSSNKADKAEWNDKPAGTAKDEEAKVKQWAQPVIGLDVKVDYKIADEGILKGAHLYAGTPAVNWFNKVVGLAFEVGVNGDLSDNTHWKLNISPSFATVTNTDDKSISELPNPDNFKAAAEKDYLKSMFKIVVYPKLEGNYGGMDWDLGVKFETGRNFNLDFSGDGYTETKISVPFTCKITF